MIEIEKIVYSKIAFNPVAKRRFKLDETLHVEIHTVLDGVYEYTIDQNFFTDLRSGPRCIDWLVPWTGNDLYTLCLLTHDANFASQLMSFEFSNDLFNAMLKYAKLANWRRKAAVIAVSKFARGCYDDSDKWDKINKEKINIHWRNT